MAFFTEEMLKAAREAERSQQQIITDRWYYDQRQEDEQQATAEEEERQKIKEEEELELKRRDADAAAVATTVREEPEPEWVEEHQYGNQPPPEPMMA